MRKLLPVAVLAAGAVVAGSAMAEDYYARQYDTGGTTSAISRSMSEPMIVDVDRGNLREQPNAQANILSTLPRGQQVTVIGTANGGGWAHVLVDGLDGYMDFVQLKPAPQPYPAAYGQPGYYYPSSSSYVQPSAYSSAAPGQQSMVVIGEPGSIYAQPEPQSQVIGTVPRGTPVTVLGRAGSWAHVAVNGFDGYMDFQQLADLHGQPYYAAPSYPRSTAPAYQPAEMAVTSAGGAVHQAPDPMSPVVYTLPPGYRVQVLGSTSGGWAHVVVNGTEGYISYSELQ
ncbi:MAG TPA: SH3 domain-containing protein [Dongiaceae bacterium]|nr:SH3 domain-containing protein [Dongiaceae bacterium]